MSRTELAVVALLRRREAHIAERAYMTAKRQHKASEALRRAWIMAKARVAQAEVRL